MRIDPRLMTLVQWLSPSYPIGAFSYSHGVEAAVERGWISNADDLQEWLRDILVHGSGRTDAIWVRLAHAAEHPDAVAALQAEACAYMPAAERLREARLQGAAFAQTTRAVWGDDLPDLLLPLAVGRGAALQGIEIDAVVPLYLQAMVSNLVAAAQRLLPIGQTAGQRILAGLHDTCLDVASATEGATLTDVSGTAFLSDIAAMIHETQATRMFQS